MSDTCSNLCCRWYNTSMALLCFCKTQQNIYNCSIQFLPTSFNNYHLIPPLYLIIHQLLSCLPSSLMFSSTSCILIIFFPPFLLLTASSSSFLTSAGRRVFFFVGWWHEKIASRWTMKEHWITHLTEWCESLKSYSLS